MKKTVALFSVLYFGFISVAAQNSVGYVLEIEGNWILNGAKKISLGEKLPAAGMIRRQSASDSGARIVVADMSGKIIVTRNCAVDSCARPFTLPRLPAASGISGFFSSWMEWFFGSPAKYSAHRSRGGELSDGVLLLQNDGKIDFSSVLTKHGTAFLRWRAVSEDAARDWSKPLKLEKTAVGLALASVAGLKPGLYEFDLLRPSVGEIYEPVSTAWILICDSSDYEKSLASFRQAVALTKNWEDKVRPETARTFLQARLDHLANTTEP